MDISREARIARARDADAQLQRLTAANRALESVPDTLAEAWEALAPLLEYYYSDWMSDFAALAHDPGGRLGVLSEDGVWNEMVSFVENTRRICAEAARVIAAYEADRH